MGFFSNLFKPKAKKEDAQAAAQAQVTEFVTLLGIYNQASIAAQLGITNIKAFPDLMMYKQGMHIPTVGGKLGVGERSHVRKLMIADYGIKELFFKELDSSMRKNCRNVKDVQNFFIQFGTFTNDLLNHLYTEHQWQIMGSLLSKKMLRSTVDKAVDKMLTSTSWKTFELGHKVKLLKATSQSLGFSKEWMVEFAYNVLLLSRRKKSKK